MPRTTLRRLNGFDDTPAKLAESTLVLVDYQNTYTTGVMELDGWQAALDTAAQLLERARQEGTKVVHVVNDGGEGTPYDIRAEIGAIHRASHRPTGSPSSSRRCRTPSSVRTWPSTSTPPATATWSSPGS